MISTAHSLPGPSEWAGKSWLRRTGIGDTGGFRVRSRTWDIMSPRSTIADILERHNIEPAADRSRKSTWKEFLAQHWASIVAADFFTVKVWTAKGLQRFVVLFFIELSSRRVEIAGISAAANGLWMSQIARNLAMVEGLLAGKRYLIHDRDPLFTQGFLSMLKDAGVQSVSYHRRVRI
jgi:putative transposase